MIWGQQPPHLSDVLLCRVYAVPHLAVLDAWHDAAILNNEVREHLPSRFAPIDESAHVHMPDRGTATAAQLSNNTDNNGYAEVLQVDYGHN